MKNKLPSIHNPQFNGEPFTLPGSGQKAVLLLHGLTATPHEVRKLGSNLNRADFATTGPLLPGHGQYPAALNRVHWQEWYEAALSAFQSLCSQYPKVYVGGESAGAILALLIAARNPAAAGVLAFSPALHLVLSPGQKLFLPWLAFFHVMLPKNGLSSNTTWQGYTQHSTSAVRQLLKMQSVCIKELPAVRQPLLVVQGKKDLTIDIQSAQMVHNMAGSKVKELHWMEDSGHCVLLDKEAHRVTRLVLDFLWKT
jgi:carboxylesterase